MEFRQVGPRDRNSPARILYLIEIYRPSGPIDCKGYMRIEDQLYFAPGILFADIDLRGDDLPRLISARLRGFYLEPAYYSAQKGHAFAAGLLVLAGVDALARMQTGDGHVKRRYIKFARNNLPSFATAESAERLYENFRNGLIHEGRIKLGAQFSLETPDTLMRLERIMIINPVRLADEVCRALDAYLAALHRDAHARQRLSNSLIQDHDIDLRPNNTA